MRDGSSLRLSILLTALLVGACSTAAEHKEVFASFAASTEKATSALEAYDKAAAAGMTEHMKAYALTLPPERLGAPEGECVKDAPKGCSVVIKNEEGSPDQIEYLNIIPKHVDAAREVARYAKALSDLAAADSTEAVAAALDKAKAGASSLINIMYPGGGAAFDTLAGPLNSATVFLYKTAQEQAKMEILRNVTAAANDTIQEAAQMFSNVAELASVAPIGKLETTFVKTEMAYQKGQGDKTLSEYLGAARLYNKTLLNPPANLFAQMGEAHAKLTEDLKGKIDNFADVIEVANRLANTAEEVYAIAKMFEKANPK